MPRPPTGPRFTPRAAPDPDVATYAGHGITTAPYRYRVRLTVRAPAAVVGEVVRPTTGQVRALDDGSCEVVGGGVSLPLIAQWVARLGADVVVHEPEELRPHLAALADRLGRAAVDRG